jgi:hypothetical protein
LLGEGGFLVGAFGDEAKGVLELELELEVGGSDDAQFTSEVRESQ